MWVVKFTSQPLLSQEIVPQHVLNRRLIGPQSRSGRFVEERNLKPLPNIGPVFVGCLRSIVIAPSSIYPLPWYPSGQIYANKKKSQRFWCVTPVINLIQVFYLGLKMKHADRRVTFCNFWVKVLQRCPQRTILSLSYVLKRHGISCRDATIYINA